MGSKEVTRRTFLKAFEVTAGVIGGEYLASRLGLPKVHAGWPTLNNYLDYLEGTIPKEPTLPIQEFLDQYPQIAPITCVNLSCIPDQASRQVYGREAYYSFSGFHNPREILFHAIPYCQDGEKANGYGEGLAEAINRGQSVFLIIEIPGAPREKDCQSMSEYVSKVLSWMDEIRCFEQRIKERASFFKGPTTFIIGNEHNDPYSYWKNNIDKYAELYLAACKIIKAQNPNNRVFPYQEAYFGDGETLIDFLKQIRQQNGSVAGLVDGLAVNVYDESSLIPGRVARYKEILAGFGLADKPIVISELGKPIDFMPTELEKANYVVQHLCTCAYLQKRGQIETAAWFAGFTPACHPQDFALTTSENNEFVVYPAFFAYVASQRLLAAERINFEQVNDLTYVSTFNQGKQKAVFIWNSGENTINFKIDLKGKQAFSPDGKRLSPAMTVSLSPANYPHPGGSLILIYR